MTAKIQCFLLIVLACSLGSSIGAGEQNYVTTTPPKVAKDRKGQASFIKKVFGPRKEKKSWWETMTPHEDRKAWTPVEPPKLDAEGVELDPHGEKEKEEVTQEERLSSEISEPKGRTTMKMPRAFLTLRGGAMKPELSKWDQFYEDSKMKNLGFELGYHLRWGISLLGRAQAMEASGKGLLNSTNTLGAEVDYSLYPLQAGLQWEFAFTPKDLLRPYVAGGYAHALYRQEISDGRKFKGKVTGHWAKGGLLFDLSGLDERSFRSGQDLYEHVDLVMEVERLWLESEAIHEDIGGLNFGVGIRIGF